MARLGARPSPVHKITIDFLIIRLYFVIMASPQKRRNFTFALNVEDTPNLDKTLLTVRQMGAYAYILHDKDEGVKPHYHFYIEFPSPRSFPSVADDLEIPINQLQKVISKKGILQYLIHKNEPEKFQYPIESIETNLPPVFFEDDTKEAKVERFRELVEDFIAYKEGRMTYREFIYKREYILCDIKTQKERQ